MHTKLAFYLAIQNKTFDRHAIPSDLYHVINLDDNGKYLPLLHVDGLSTLERHMVVSETFPYILYFQSFNSLKLYRENILETSTFAVIIITVINLEFEKIVIRGISSIYFLRTL